MQLKKMHTMWMPTLAAVAIALVALPRPALACNGKLGGGPGGCIERNADALGLDSDTLAKVDAIAADARAQCGDLRVQVREARQEMRRLLAADTPDEAAVMAQADRIGEAMTAVHKHHLATLLKIRALLTPEQRQQLMSMCGRRGPGGSGMGPGPDGGPPCGGPGMPCGADGPPCGGPPPAAP